VDSCEVSSQIAPMLYNNHLGRHQGMSEPSDRRVHDITKHLFIIMNITIIQQTRRTRAE